MEPFSYDNIDLFYYHQIDYDFSRFYSILENGILSTNAINDKKVKYYYRNYPNSSAKDAYISVSEFSRTFLHLMDVENELYQSGKNKITFVLPTNINASEKKHYKKRNVYTKERHVYYGIDPTNLYGILLCKNDAFRPISEYKFNINFTKDIFFIKKILVIIEFFKDKFNFFYDEDKIYTLIGKYEKTLLFYPNMVKDEKLKLATTVSFSISQTIIKILNKEDATILDFIDYLNIHQLPIYIMNKYDIKHAYETLKEADERLEKLKLKGYDSKEIKEKREQEIKERKYLKRLSNEALEYYLGYSTDESKISEEDHKILSLLHKENN